MEFFNKKEDVIDLELTPYGEFLLSKGTFKPEFYAFYDDGILYDSTYGGIGEEQSKTKERIKEVPRLKTQYIFANTELPNMDFDAMFEELAAELYQAYEDKSWAVLEKGIAKGQALVEKQKHADTQLEELGLFNYAPTPIQYTLPLPLGNSSFDSDKAPAWDVNLLYNSIDSSVGYFSSSMHPHLKIPQLDVTIQYETEGMPLNKSPSTSEDNTSKTRLRLKEFDELHENPPLYGDGFYDFQEDFIVLEINEHNVPFLKENFDIEIFEVLYDNTSKHDFDMERKFFTTKPSVVNEKGLLKSQKEIVKSNEEDLELKLLPLDQTYVERFFNVSVDHEIDKDLICQLKPNVKQKGSFVSDPLDCFEDKEVNILSSDIYKDTTETKPECD